MGKLTVPESEVEFTAIRAGGPGGQHVNKVSTAVQLRFDIHASSLPGEVKARLLAYPDQRISSDGLVVVKAQRFRSQDRNRQDALQRLQALVEKAAHTSKARIATRPGKGAVEKRLQDKKRQGQKKSGRGAVVGDDS